MQLYIGSADQDSPVLVYQERHTLYGEMEIDTFELVHGLLVVEDILDKAVGFVLNELLPFKSDHASTVLTTML